MGKAQGRRAAPEECGWTGPKIHPSLLSALARTFTLALAMLGFCATVAGCAESGPDNPTYDQDVRPLLVARCVRCHSTPGQVDPLSAKTGMPILKAGGSPSFDYQYLSDVPDATMTYLKDLPKYIRGVAQIGRMPPPPAATLEDWEVEMLGKWGTNPK